MPGPDRRSVLAAAALVGVAGPVRALARNLPDFEERAGGPPVKIRYKKAVKWGMVQTEGSVLEKFTLLRELGFDGVELDSPSDLDPDEVLAAMEATGLEVPGVVDSVHWRDTLGDPDAEVRARGRAGLETALRDCARYGGTSVLLVPAVVSKTISYDTAWTNSQAEIRHVLPLAEELGLTIAFENVWNRFLLSPLEAARYVDEFESSRVAWHLDLGNLVNFGYPEQWVRILGARIAKLDIKDFSNAKRDNEGLWAGFAVGIGDGDVDWPATCLALDEVGYPRGDAGGWAAAEVSGGGAERLAEIAARMDRVLAE